MKSATPVKHFVASLRKPADIDISGFESADEVVHMIEWLGKGSDFRQFVVNDIEAELYSQDQGSQVLSVVCVAKPEYETKIRRQGDSQKGILVQFSITFPVAVRVRATSGAIWQLDVRHNYHATDLDVPGQRKLRLNFTIVGQQSE